MNTGVIQCAFETYGTSVPFILDQLDVKHRVKGQETILLKPNLVNADPFPITTSPHLCRAVIRYLKTCCDARIIIAEGCGDAVLETDQVFNRLGYDRLAAETGVELMDLNHAPLKIHTRPENRIFPEFYLPEIADGSFIISLPVLKAHSLAVITGTLKNMMGFAPPAHYSGGGAWKKAAFHSKMQRSVMELNRYILPDLTLMDASVGLSEYHLGGPICDPPVNRLLAGTDPFALDQAAARLLDIDPESIPHIQSPQG
ncbi:MAG TPA: hypothetical protein DHV36_20780 [Desulfobacteraceae bacterium]|nr:hypothetical protein [Desulfobacteraceae bacterium]|tara:strand:+ start:16 stop:786 length:771 start_codon:yes stop_codon:yes gene_type:complete